MGLSTVTRRLFGVGAASLLATPSRAQLLLGVGHGAGSGYGGGGPSTPASTALFHFDGANGSTSFPDSSGNGFTFTPSGAVALSTAQFKFGTASVQLPGGTAHITSTNTLTLGTGDYTIDYWLYQSGASAYVCYYLDDGASGSYIQMYGAGGGSVIDIYEGNTLVINGTTGINTNTWYHLALTRASGTLRFFVNGTQNGANHADTANYTGIVGNTIGSRTDGTNAMTGFVDEFRIIAGTAAWTANFTPPTAPYTH